MVCHPEAASASIVGALMALTGAGCLTYLYPPLQDALSAYLPVSNLLGEASLTLWLLVVGVNTHRWNERACAAERLCAHERGRWSWRHAA
jgi:hypothetical protein